MKKNKLIIAAAVTAAVGATTLAGVQMASAQSSNGATGAENLIQKIAQKFNLNQTDVKAVFDQNKADNQATRKQNITDKLTQLVKDGKLTEDQKQKILDKLTEIQSNMAANRTANASKTAAERKAARDAQKADLEAWAKANNIPTDYLQFFGGSGRRAQ